VHNLIWYVIITTHTGKAIFSSLFSKLFSSEKLRKSCCNYTENDLPWTLRKYICMMCHNWNIIHTHTYTHIRYYKNQKYLFRFHGGICVFLHAVVYKKYVHVYDLPFARSNTISKIIYFKWTLSPHIFVMPTIKQTSTYNSYYRDAWNIGDIPPRKKKHF
jgi:hypothetical protein